MINQSAFIFSQDIEKSDPEVIIGEFHRLHLDKFIVQIPRFVKPTYFDKFIKYLQDQKISFDLFIELVSYLPNTLDISQVDLMEWIRNSGAESLWLRVIENDESLDINQINMFSSTVDGLLNKHIVILSRPLLFFKETSLTHGLLNFIDPNKDSISPIISSDPEQSEGSYLFKAINSLRKNFDVIPTFHLLGKNEKFINDIITEETENVAYMGNQGVFSDNLEEVSKEITEIAVKFPKKSKKNTVFIPKKPKNAKNDGHLMARVIAPEVSKRKSTSLMCEVIGKLYRGDSFELEKTIPDGNTIYFQSSEGFYVVAEHEGTRYVEIS